MSSNKISAIGLGSILLCTVAPLMRLTYNGVGILLIVFFVALLLTIFSKQKKRIKGPQRLILIILVWSCISTLLYYGFVLDRLKILFAAIVLFLHFPNKRELDYILCLQLVISLFFIYAYFYMGENWGGGIRKFIVIQGNNYDPNVIAGSFFIPAVLAVKFFFEKKKLITRFMIVVFLGLLIISILMSGTRGGLIAFVITIFTYLSINKLTSKTQIVFFVLAIALGLIYMFGNANELLTNDVLTRFTIKEIDESGGSGRVELAALTFTYLLDQANVFQVLFGMGFGSAVDTIGMGTHNTILDFLWGNGIVGLVALIVIFIKVLKFCFKSKNALSISCLIGTLVWALDLSASNLLLFWVSLYISMSIANLESKNKMLR